MPDDDKTFPPFEGPHGDDAIEAIARDVEQQLAKLAGSDAARRKLVALLSHGEKSAASERLALRARKFAAQAGRCAQCRNEFGAARRPAPMLEASPLLCMPCNRDRLTGAKRVVAKKV